MEDSVSSRSSHRYNSVQNDEHLEAERMMHRDLIRGAQREHYYNLTLKTQMGLEWGSKYCDFQYLLKADDDVFVNPYLLTDLGPVQARCPFPVLGHGR